MDTDSLTVADAANDTALPNGGYADQSPENAAQEPTSEEALEASLSDKFDRLNEAEEQSAAETNGANRADQPYDGVSEQSDVTAIAPPASWSAEMHSHWTSLPPQIQTYVSQREQDASRKISEQGNELGRARPVVDLFDRYQQNFDRHGISLEDGMASLMQAQEMLDQKSTAGHCGHRGDLRASIFQVFSDRLRSSSVRKFSNWSPRTGSTRPPSTTCNVIKGRDRSLKIGRFTVRHFRIWGTGPWTKSTLPPWRIPWLVFCPPARPKDLDEAYDMACHAVPEIRQELLEADRMRAAEERRMADAQTARDAMRMAQTNIGNRAARPAVAA